MLVIPVPHILSICSKFSPPVLLWSVFSEVKGTNVCSSKVQIFRGTHRVLLTWERTEGVGSHRLSLNQGDLFSTPELTAYVWLKCKTWDRETPCRVTKGTKQMLNIRSKQSWDCLGTSGFCSMSTQTVSYIMGKPGCPLLPHSSVLPGLLEWADWGAVPLQQWKSRKAWLVPVVGPHKSLATCCSSWNYFLGELFGLLNPSSVTSVDLCQDHWNSVLHLPYLSLLLGNAVIYKIHWKTRAELFATCVGLLSSAVVVGEDPSFQAVVSCRDAVWHKNLYQSE